MKRRTRLLKHTAIESLTLSVVVFNRPSPTARTQGVLLNLQHAFEMLFKAVVWEDRGSIEPKGRGPLPLVPHLPGHPARHGLLSEGEAVVAATIEPTSLASSGSYPRARAAHSQPESGSSVHAHRAM